MKSALRGGFFEFALGFRGTVPHSTQVLQELCDDSDWSLEDVMEVTLKMRVIVEQRVREVSGSLVACYGSTNTGRFVVVNSGGKNYAGFATLEALEKTGIDTAVAAE